MPNSVTHSCPTLSLSRGELSLEGTGVISQLDNGRLVGDFNFVDADFLIAGNLCNANDAELRGQTTSGLHLHGCPVSTSGECRWSINQLSSGAFHLELARCTFSTLPEADGWTRCDFYITNAKIDKAVGLDESCGHWSCAPLEPQGMLMSLLKGAEIVHDPVADLGMLSDLLSFAMRCPCIAVRADVYQEGQLVTQKLLSDSHQAQVVAPLLPKGADSLARFLEHAIPSYRSKSSRYNMKVLLGYYWRMHFERSLEIKFILGSVLLEAFKFYWAKSETDIPNSRISAQYKKDSLIRGYYEQLNKKGEPILLSFEELLSRAVTSVGLEGINTDFIDERNCLFHSGTASHSQLGQSDTYAHLVPRLNQMFEDIDRLLLAILEFKGTICSWWDHHAILVR